MTRPATLASPALNLTWDFGNQLSGVDTNGTPASHEVTFRYDVLGRRVGRVEGGSSIVFVQAGQQTVADYDAGQIPGKPNHIYVYGSYIDEPIVRRNDCAPVIPATGSWFCWPISLDGSKGTLCKDR